MSSGEVDRSSPPLAASRRSAARSGPDVTAASSLPELVSGAAAGDAESWAEISHRFTNLLWAVARSHRLNSDDASDVVQNTWLRLLENIQRIEHPEALPGWLTTTARREALSLIRRRRRDVPVDQHDFQTFHQDTPELDAGLLVAERDAQLWSCFGQLPGRDQELLRALISCDRPSYTAVAAALDMPVGSIGPTRMRAALIRLRDMLEASDYVFRETVANGTPYAAPQGAAPALP
jgi:RNA polymerase sigma factor (sigma-70 family)